MGLSRTQEYCIKKAQESRGVLVRYEGGFWSAEDVPMSKVYAAYPGSRFNCPEWYFGTSTIRALINKGIFVITQTQKMSWGNRRLRWN